MPNRIQIENVRVIIHEVIQHEMHLNASDQLTSAMLQRIENLLLEALNESYQEEQCKNKNQVPPSNC
jgi:hypothetical protein